uniref:Uncharacterized protein n=1 Tax=Octopus bimaculoides TaxID=37653 RepID=A0A0L8IEA1_OCTBM
MSVFCDGVLNKYREIFYPHYQKNNSYEDSHQQNLTFWLIKFPTSIMFLSLLFLPLLE